MVYIIQLCINSGTLHIHKKKWNKPTVLHFSNVNNIAPSYQMLKTKKLLSEYNVLHIK